MKIRKTRVSMAIAAVLSAACLAPATSFGYSINLQGPDAGTLNTNSTGDALLYPFYTVVNDATTSVSITNTSSTETVLTKIRIREQIHSMDALDFFVVLSPNDKFDFTLSLDKAKGLPKMTWLDSSCVIGPKQGANEAIFHGKWKPFVENDEQLRSGHIEIMGLVDLTGTALGDAAKHVGGKPKNCALLVSTLADPLKVNALNKTTLHDAGNVLMGRYIITKQEMGLEAGGDAIALRDSNLAAPIDNTGMWHLTAQSPKMCNLIASGASCKNSTASGEFIYAWDQQEESHPHMAELQTHSDIKDAAGNVTIPATGLIAFQRGLSALNIAGDWSNNAGNSVGFDWVVTFPDKYTYMDCAEYIAGPTSFQYDRCTWEILKDPKVSPHETLPELSGVWYNGAGIGSTLTRDIAIPIDLAVYDIDENGLLSGIDYSPTTPGMVPSLYNEVNVFTLKNDDLNQTLPASQIQVNGTTDAWVRRIINFSLGANAKRGWAELQIGWEIPARPAAVTGIIYTTRADPADVNHNNASLTDLQKY